MNSKQTIIHFYAIDKNRPPCIPKEQGFIYGHYFAVDSDKLRNEIMEQGGGKSNFDTYDSCGLFWWAYRNGCGGQTPFGFEKIGFVIEKWDV